MARKPSEYILSSASLKRLFRSQADVRVSDGAIAALRDRLEHELESVASNAIRAAKHAGRRTVLGSDVNFVQEKRWLDKKEKK